jgi:cytochrome b
VSEQHFIAYEVWDRPTRCFHWINVVAVLGLVAIGLVIFNAKTLGVQTPGKILLKEIHVWVGYVFAVNLVVRLIWGFVGNRYARWGSILPGRHGYLQSVRAYVHGRGPRHYLGHNPLGRISVTIMLILLVIQATTGLVLAGTDIFYPPLGGWIAEWVAADGVDPGSLVAYAPAMYDEQAYQGMRAFRSPFITTHVYAFYTLVVVIVAHIAAVVIAEVRNGGSLISAMITGRKVFSDPPSDVVE